MTINTLADPNILIKQVYEPAGIKLSAPVVMEKESVDYGACRFGLDGYHVVFRVAKITPTKKGLFVTLWKRPKSSDVIQPFDANDPIDFVIVSASHAKHRGQFIFDKNILLKKGVLLSQKHAGKRAMRVYPPWSYPVAKQAVITQKWQLPYFVHFSEDETVDASHVRRLLSNYKNQEALPQ